MNAFIKFCRTAAFAAFVWLSAVPAIGQDANSVTLKLSAADVAEIMRLADLQAPSLTNPPAYWDLQLAIDKALQANPAAARAFLQIRGAKR
jgi:hypothetical protein